MWTEQKPDVSGGSQTSFERPIDLVHLARQTLGDRSLEQEILALYHKQAQTLLHSIETTANLRERCDYAHMLKGSSRAVGAWHVATAAEAVEIASPAVPSDAAHAIAALRRCVVAACDTIAELRRTH